MERYLDPKADITFKKVFGNHPDLLISLLNALLPLAEDEQIESIEYLPAELESVNPLRKNTIVDVRCKDVSDRQFVVEMRMEWTSAFLQRVLFNASKAYVSQADKGFRYENLMPVYSLSLINDTYTDKSSPDFVHNYNIVCDQDTRLVIKGLHFTFVELPKFKPHTIQEKKMAVLWLRYLTEIDDRTREVPAELLENPVTSKALEEIREAAFTEEELRTYEKFWDMVSTERTLMEGRYDEGLADGLVQGKAEGIAEGLLQGKAEGKAEGIAEGIVQGKAEGERSKSLEIARNLLALHLPAEDIAAATGLSVETIEALRLDS